MLNVIRMKKTIKKRLTLRSETIKVLTDEQLYAARVGGGGLDQYNKCTAGYSGCSTDWAKKCSYAL